MNEYRELVSFFRREMDITAPEGGSGLKDLLLAIEERVRFFLDTQPGLLMSYLYRLDIPENEVRSILNSGKEEDKKIAQLILERQIKRLRTKKEFKQKPIEGWEW